MPFNIVINGILIYISLPSNIILLFPNTKSKPKSDMTDKQKIDINGGHTQVCPNASQAIQNIYIGKEYIHELLQARVSETASSTEGEIVDMYYFSCTHPLPIANEISRKAIIELCEKRLDTDNVLCLTGEEGIGLTTILAQFAKLPTISNDDLNTLCEITRGIPSRMETVLRKYVHTKTLQQLIDSNATGESDLFDDDFHKIFHGCADEMQGLKVNSLVSLGKKEYLMSEVGTTIIMTVLNSYRKYAMSLAPRVKGEDMEYSEVELD